MTTCGQEGAMTTCGKEWARENYGKAPLRDLRLRRCLIKLAASMSTHSRGTVAASLADPALERSTYRLLNNTAKDRTYQDFLDSPARATLRRAEASCTRGYLVTPVDWASHKLSDRAKRRQVGGIGTSKTRTRGLHFASAVGVDPDTGQTLGVVAMRGWPRTPKPKTRARREALRRASFESKEQHVWFQVTVDALKRARDETPELELWAQYDRGADSHQLIWALSDLPGLRWTIRCTQNRRLEQGRGSPKLFDELAKQPLGGGFEVDLGRPGSSKARRAAVGVSWMPVELPLRERGKSKPYARCRLWAVQARELDSSAPRKKGRRLCWRVLTSHPVEDLESALEVVSNYRLRWRVEEFHRAWKADGQVEEHRLVSFDAIMRWSVLKAVAAVRAETLKIAAREHPHESALKWLSQAELEAILKLRHGKKTRRRATHLKMGEAVLWLAQLGGYGPKRKDRQPGATVITRGLQRIAPVVQLLDEGFAIKS